MANIYLEKIAGLVDVAKYVGSKAKLALGVGERDYLAKTLKTNNPKKVMDIGEKFNSFATRRKILKAKMNPTPKGDKAAFRSELGKAKTTVKSDLKDLHERKTDARIIVGVGAGGGLALHKKYQESKQQAYPQTYYDYQ